MTEIYDIKNRYTGSVIYSAKIECPSDAPDGVKKGLAIREAVNAGVILSRADLCGADLSRADLCGADLSRADLCGADLSRADLCGANLSGADLSRANLSGADLCGTDLFGADLSGTDLLVFQGFGSGARTLFAHKRKSDRVVEIRTGCFFGTMDEFLKAVEEKHGDNHYGKAYRALCDLINLQFGETK